MIQALFNPDSKTDWTKYLKWLAIAAAAYYAYTKIRDGGGLNAFLRDLLGTPIHPQAQLPPAYTGPLATTSGQPIIGVHPTEGYGIIARREVGGTGINAATSIPSGTNLVTGETTGISSRSTGGTTGRSGGSTGGVRGLGIQMPSGGWTQ